MEKINIKIHDNGTISFQHKKILHFVPELSKDKNMKLIVPNIPLLVSSTYLHLIKLEMSKLETSEIETSKIQTSNLIILPFSN